MRGKVSYWGVIPAAGTGVRMHSREPKQYMDLNGAAVLEHSVRSLLSDARIERVNLVVDLKIDLHVDLPVLQDSRINLVQGGVTRSDSVLAGLTELSDKAEYADWILVHDAARPCVTSQEVTKLIDIVSRSNVGGILAHPIMDTVKRTDEDGLVIETIERNGLWRALTPQMFPFGPLYEALSDAKTSNFVPTDEAAAMERMGYSVQLISGLATNVKITVPSDIEFARLVLTSSKSAHVSVSELD